VTVASDTTRGASVRECGRLCRARRKAGDTCFFSYHVVRKRLGNDPRSRLLHSPADLAFEPEFADFTLLSDYTIMKKLFLK
jgi:hypothetical protein